MNDLVTLFNKLNSEVFDRQLPRCDIEEVDIIDNDKKIKGKFVADIYWMNDGSGLYKLTNISNAKILIVRNWPDLESVLCHEMIHYWEHLYYYKKNITCSETMINIIDNDHSLLFNTRADIITLTHNSNPNKYC